MIDNPILTICIPTYNRDELLKETLKSIVYTHAFADGKVNIAVSNNASTDNTSDVCQKFEQQYPKQIFINQQVAGIDPAENFRTVLGMGTGTFLKLHNDSHKFASGSLDKFIEDLEQYQNLYDIVFPMDLAQEPENIDLAIK